MLPLFGCAGNALLVCAPTDSTRTGKSVPGGSAVPGFGAEVPAAAAPLVAGVFTVCVAGAAADRFSGVPCVTACGVGAALVGCPAAGCPVPDWLVVVAWPAPVVWFEVMVWPVAAEDAVVAAEDDGNCDWAAAPPGDGEGAFCGVGVAAVLAALAPVCTGGPGCRVIAGLPCWAFTAGCCACDAVLGTGWPPVGICGGAA